MSRVAIITARGGSKRIPRKNIKEFCGKPIIAYSIEAALESGLFEEVMVSTEDEEIAEIAKKYGAKVPFMRSDETAGDHTATVDVILEVLRDYKERGQEFDTACCIYPTAPFVTAEKLIKAQKKLEEMSADALVPVVRFSFPPQRCFIIEEEMLRYKWKENEFKRSQDLEPFYHDAGQFYILKTETVFEKHTLVPENTIPFVLDEMEVQDIDNYEDWKIAEVKYERMSHS
ncbi:MAG: pseudaminic acid cytidylyltransferase [Lachnospiraceae bacterium]|nr:pseudaminic acid cytidylyltransferase [Lachnospiraceae bacterium]